MIRGVPEWNHLWINIANFPDNHLRPAEKYKNPARWPDFQRLFRGAAFFKCDTLCEFLKCGSLLRGEAIYVNPTERNGLLKGVCLRRVGLRIPLTTKRGVPQKRRF